MPTSPRPATRILTHYTIAEFDEQWDVSASYDNPDGTHQGTVLLWEGFQSYSAARTWLKDRAGYSPAPILSKTLGTC